MDFELFERIIKDECKTYSPERVPSFIDLDKSRGEIVYRPELFHDLALRALDVAKSSFVPRGYNGPYGLSDADFFFESVGAHANLTVEVITQALDTIYDVSFGNNMFFSRISTVTIDGYTYREVVEVARLHDLPENETGDIPDHGSRDEELKMATEFDYIERHLSNYPDKEFSERVLKLFNEMQMLSSPTGILLYLADKVAALIVTLALDRAGHSPMISPDGSYLTERDIQEIEMCDRSYDGKYKASEMWAIDYFKIRDIVRLDKDMFFTALIVATTLVVNGRWYGWREKDYLAKKCENCERCENCTKQ